MAQLGTGSELLPFGADECDKRTARETALELLNDIPLEASDWQVQAEIREALQPLCKEIQNNQKIDELLAYGRTCVGEALFDLYRDDCITREDWLDVELRGQLQEIVTEELSQGGDYALDGSETREDVKEMVADIIVDELDLEVVEDGSGDAE